MVWHGMATVCPLPGHGFHVGPWCHMCDVEAALDAGYMPA